MVAREITSMGGAKFLNLTLLMVFLILNPKMESATVIGPPVLGQPVRVRPLCISQFALVNHACAMLPFTPGPPPSPSSPPPPPPDDDSPKQEHRSRHGHGHRHRHGHRHGHQETPVQQDCCRWLKEVDEECVCDMLVYLPPFLSRPVHQYSVLVDDSCNVTYQCGSRIRI